MTTTRSRSKSAPTAPVDTAATAADTAAPAANTAVEALEVAVPAEASPADSPAPASDPTPIPSATPLNAPDPATSEAPEQQPEMLNVADALPEAMDGLIVDAATRKPPTELETVFERATPHGTDAVCTLRLLEHTIGSRHSRPMTRLLVARGSHLSGESVSRIMQTLRNQAAAPAASN